MGMGFAWFLINHQGALGNEERGGGYGVSDEKSRDGGLQ